MSKTVPPITETIPSPTHVMPNVPGIDELRMANNLFNNCKEDFNMQFTFEQLVLIYRAYRRSQYDITPDRWTEDELQAALAGLGTGAEFER